MSWEESSRVVKVWTGMSRSLSRVRTIHQLEAIAEALTRVKQYFRTNTVRAAPLEVRFA